MARQINLTNEEINKSMKFLNFMCRRFYNGKKKYGMKYLKRDNLTELQMELIDVANYAMMEFMKIEAMKN